MIIYGYVSNQEKLKIIKINQINDKDTGSPEVQVSLLSTQIDELAKHLKKHKKDNSSQRFDQDGCRQTHPPQILGKKDKTRYNALMKKWNWFKHKTSGRGFVLY